MATSGKKMNPLPVPASRLWEASIRKLQTIRRAGSVVPAALPGDPLMSSLLSVSSSSSNTIYRYNNDDEGGDRDSDSATEGEEDDTDAGEDDDDGDESLGEPSHAEQLLPTGEFYQGSRTGTAGTSGATATSTSARGAPGRCTGGGTVIWADGDRYDGAWEAGRPRGQGTFRWADGSMYIGNWSMEDEEDGGGGMMVVDKGGVYYPSSGGPPVPASAREPCDAFTALLKELEVSEGKMASLMPWQKVLTWPGVEGVHKKPVWRPPEVSASAAEQAGRRSSAHGRSSISSDVDALLVVDGEDGGGEETRADRSCLRTPSCMRSTPPPKPGKKQGETKSKGHKNYELMLNLQLGIRHAVGRQSAPTSLDLKSSAFDPKEKVWTRFPPRRFETYSSSPAM
ncbi:hypothetical protein EJB05_29578, partial [Eragrostis curvula]